jgi:hypothetical protein
MTVPNSEGTQVLALIETIGTMGVSKWYEVVYYLQGDWHSYMGSSTFTNGEKVIKWEYCAVLIKR